MIDSSNLADRALTVWMITDGKIGDDVQCRAVASRLSPQFEEKRVAPRAPWVWTAPWGMIDPRDAPAKAQSPIAPPFPDVAVVSGRRAIPYARAVKRESGGKTLLVFLKNPRAAFDEADVIWAPAHDKIQGANIFSTLTSPHGVEPLLKAAKNSPMPAIAALPKPMLGVVLGGVGGGAKYDEGVAAELAGDIKAACKTFASVAVTPSRRTPEFLLHAVSDAVAEECSFVWDRTEDNPYIDILANADALVVTADSHNMMSEALATGVGVNAFVPPQLAPKLLWFLSNLEESGDVSRFARHADVYSRTPINATDEIVGEIKRRLAEKYNQ